MFAGSCFSDKPADLLEKKNNIKTINKKNTNRNARRKMKIPDQRNVY